MVKLKCSRRTLSLNLWVSSHDKLSDFYASSWQRGDSAVPLLVLRVLLAAVALAILVWSVYEAANSYWLVYLTNWGLFLTTSMMLAGVFVSIMAVSRKITDVDGLPWYVSTYWFLYNISISIALLITALYWILLYEPGSWDSTGRRLFWLDVATHGINSCVAFAELLFSRTPVNLLHVYQPLGVGMWYAAFTAVYFAVGGTDPNGFPFIYEILDWRQGKRAGAIIGIAAFGLFIIYILLWGIALCRDKLSSVLRTTSIQLTHTNLAPTPQNNFV